MQTAEMDPHAPHELYESDMPDRRSGLGVPRHAHSGPPARMEHPEPSDYSRTREMLASSWLATIRISDEKSSFEIFRRSLRAASTSRRTPLRTRAEVLGAALR